MKKTFTKTFLFFPLLTLILLLPGCAQQGQELKPLQEDIEKLKEGQANILQELQDLKKVVSARPSPTRPAEFEEAVINIPDDPIKGEKTAKVTILDFTDYQ